MHEFVLWSTWSLDPVLFALALAAHSLAEFLFQLPPRARAPRAGLGRALGHGLIVAFTLAVALVTTAGSVRVAALGVATSLGLAAVHLSIDALCAPRGKTPAVGRPLRMLMDQALHVVSLISAVVVFERAAALVGEPLDVAANGLFGATPQLIFASCMVLAAFAFAAGGGAAIVGATLERFDVGPEPREPLLLAAAPDSPPNMGRLIGVLERWLVLTFALIGQWGSVGLVMAAKSIARFRQLEERRFGEYYLIGTLCSLLVAVLLGLGLRAMFAALGLL